MVVIKGRLNLKGNLYQVLQTLIVTPFDKVPIVRVISSYESDKNIIQVANQLNLFN